MRRFLSVFWTELRMRENWSMPVVLTLVWVLLYYFIILPIGTPSINQDIFLLFLATTALSWIIPTASSTVKKILPKVHEMLSLVFAVVAVIAFDVTAYRVGVEPRVLFYFSLLFAFIATLVFVVDRAALVEGKITKLFKRKPSSSGQTKKQ